jgi:hypothetical protein
MKAQFITATAAFFAASVAAFPTPQPETTNNHGLIPDFDDWNSDADAVSIEVLTARGPRVISTAAANFNFTDDFNFPLDHLFAEIEAIPDEVLAQGDEALHKWLVEHGDRAGDDIDKLKRDDGGYDVEEEDWNEVEDVAGEGNEAATVVERSDEDDEVVGDDFGGEEGNEAAVVVERSDEDEVEGGDADSDGLDILARGEIAARASLWKITKCVAAIVQLLATTAVPAAKLLRIKQYIKALGGTRQAVKLLLGATTRAEKLKAGGEILVNLSAELLGISTVKTQCF